MKASSFLYLAAFGLRTILFRREDPILGTVILTDQCNLTCKHCSVNNLRGVLYPYARVRADMETLYAMGVRILFFCGGETFLWRDGTRTLRDLVREAKAMGFLIVNVVTNGTFPIDLPEADLILLSLDGDRALLGMERPEGGDYRLVDMAGNVLSTLPTAFVEQHRAGTPALLAAYSYDEETYATYTTVLDRDGQPLFTAQGYVGQYGDRLVYADEEYYRLCDLTGEDLLRIPRLGV